MDDDKKNGKPKGPRESRPGGARSGKPGGKGFGGKPFGPKPDGAKKFGAKTGGGKRPFARDAGTPGEAGARPFRSGPRTERAGSADARRADGKPRFSNERSFSGEKRPYRDKREFSRDADAPRQKREFSGDRAPRAGSGGRPFDKGPRREGAGDAERKPSGKPPFSKERSFSGEKRPYPDKREFSRDADAPRQKREFSGDRPPRAAGERAFDKGPRREGPGDGERKPFGKDQRPRPGRFERDEARHGGDKPRSFGMKRHAGPGGEGGERPRSHGMKSHPGAKSGADRFPPRASEAVEEAGERIAKRLARAGIASRREAEDLVEAGRVRVNGQVLASPAFNVTPEDRIELDSVEIPPIERTRLFLFHKPAGVVTTNRDPEGRRTVFDVLPEGLPRLMTVGRLDINTEGLLLLTNDGGLARVLELPSTGWLRRYRVRVHGQVDEKALAGLREGAAVDGVFYGAIEASLDRVQGTNAWLNIGLREGKNREVKNVLGALGLEVTRLIRVSFGPFQLGDVPEGEVQELKGRTLRDQLGERLIEEAGANFEAPVTKPFSNRAEQRRPAPAEGGERPRSRPRPVEIGEGGLIKGRKRRREDARDEALGKLSTRPERGRFGKGTPGSGFAAKPFGKPARDERETRGPQAPVQRKANVWMAPGARPQGNAGKPRSSKDDEGRAGARGKSVGEGVGGRPAGRSAPSAPKRGEARGPRRPQKG